MKRLPPSSPGTRLALLLAIGALGAPSCARIAVPQTTEEGLRTQLKDLTRKHDDLERQVRDLEAKLAEKPRPAGSIMSSEAESVLPRLVDVKVSDMSSVRPDAAGGPTLRLAIEPADGRGRFIQITGTLAVSVKADTSLSETVLLGDLSVGPKALSDAYRLSLVGNYYSFEIPLKLEGRPTPSDVTVSCEFTDAVTGKVFKCKEIVPVRQLAATSGK